MFITGKQIEAIAEFADGSGVDVETVDVGNVIRATRLVDNASVRVANNGIATRERERDDT